MEKFLIDLDYQKILFHIVPTQECDDPLHLHDLLKKCDEIQKQLDPLIDKNNRM